MAKKEQKKTNLPISKLQILIEVLKEKGIVSDTDLQRKQVELEG